MNQPTEKQFFVQRAGRTNGAHLDFVERLQGIGHMEVTSLEGADYRLIFCPVVSRVGTDVSEALADIRDDKPTVLVVMHHTFNPDHVVADSRRLVENPNVCLVVDCLFYEDKFLRCNRNDIAWYEIQKLFGVQPSRTIPKRGFSMFGMSWTWKKSALVGFAVAAVVTTFLLSYFLVSKKK